ncbi:MAG: IclR family transcriptional regulator [Lautropia sp.]
MSEVNVKSARRVFEFLEHFSRERRPLSAAELAHHYGYPSSSVSAILRTMVAMGYLSYNPSARTYLPAPRLSFLVSWVGSMLYSEGRIRRIMDELSATTGETILLAMQVGLRAQYVHVIDATGPVRLFSKAGDFRPLLHSAVGLALLSGLETPALRRLVTRLNAEESNPDRRVESTTVLETMADIRRRGYAYSMHGIVTGGGAIALLLPEVVDGKPLALGIGASEANLIRNREALVGALLRAVAQHYSNAPAGDDAMP